MLLYFIEPNIADLVKFVVPNVAVHWEILAYFLEFNTSRVHIISEKRFKDPEKCCTELLIYWVNSNEGISPKTWEVLLKTMSDIIELRAVAEQIEMQVKKVTNL